jgi:hypothetical protein
VLDAVSLRHQARASTNPSTCEDPGVAGTEIAVPEALRRPHRLVVATRDAFSGVKPDETGRLQLRPRAGAAYLHVSRDELRRALLILQAIVAEAERRGWEVKPAEGGYGDKAGIGIRLRGHTYAVWITEMTDRIPLTEAELERWNRENKWRLSWTTAPTHRQVANGRLKLSLPSNYDGARCNWTEGPRGNLDSKLSSFFAELERRAEDDVRRDEERARKQEERQRAAEERAERERLARNELARVERLREEVASWRLARDARQYIEELRERLPELNENDRARIAAWCEWAEAWVGRSDPTLNVTKIVGLEEPEQAEPPFWWGGQPQPTPNR